MRTEIFQPQILQEIKDRIYLPDLVQKYTHLNRHNKGLCPFHKERNPSFSVKKDHWHCFGCNRGGDAIAFIMEVEHLTFPNTVKLLAFELGVRLPEADSIKEVISKKWQEREKKLMALDILETSFKSYINYKYAALRLKIKQLPPKEKRDAKDYLKELLIDEQFDELEDFLEERLRLFEETRRMVRNG